LFKFLYYNLSKNYNRHAVLRSVSDIAGDYTRAVPWLRRLVAGLSLLRPGFASGPVNIGFVVDEVALRQVYLRVLRFSADSITLHTHISSTG
jgi:hypothetical protein